MIGGVVAAAPDQPVLPAQLRAMAERMPGTDSVACLAKGPTGLFTDGGDVESCQDLWAVGDLDLTNLPELRAATGCRRARGLLTALYGLEGPDFVRRLRGAFALAIVDRRTKRLLLAVDRFGIKRLYYRHGCGGMVFASRAAAVVAEGNGDAAVDATAVYQYLNFGYVPAPYSIYAGLRRLPPGHTLLMEGARLDLRQYWDISYTERPIGLREGVEATYRLVREAVALAVRDASSMEIGCFLSGGTDSSTIVGLTGTVTGDSVHAFSVGFQEPQYDEMPYAETVARHFGALHHAAVLTPELALEALPRIIQAYDEPLGNDSTIATYFCASHAADAGIRVLLAGDGGDELFGGNERYRTDRILAVYGHVPKPLRRFTEALLRRTGGDGRGLLGRVRRYVRRASIPNPRRFYSYEFFVAGEADQLLRPEFLEVAAPEAPWRLLEEHYDRVRATSELNRLLYLDLKLTIGDNDLLKVTRAAELAGVGVRFPMLDHLLAEFTATLPAHYKVRAMEKRYLFKRAFRRLLPAQVLTKKKHGFGLPVSEWLRVHPEFRALARDALLGSTAYVQSCFRPRTIERLFALHDADSTPYYGHLLWSFLMLELWHAAHRHRVAAL